MGITYCIDILRQRYKIGWI